MGVSVGAGRLGMLAAQFEWLTEPGFRRVRAMPEDGSRTGSHCELLQASDARSAKNSHAISCHVRERSVALLNVVTRSCRTCGRLLVTASRQWPAVSEFCDAPRGHRNPIVAQGPAVHRSGERVARLALGSIWSGDGGELNAVQRLGHLSAEAALKCRFGVNAVGELLRRTRDIAATSRRWCVR